jgi:hypothetical protein
MSNEWVMTTAWAVLNVDCSNAAKHSDVISRCKSQHTKSKRAMPDSGACGGQKRPRAVAQAHAVGWGASLLGKLSRHRPANVIACCRFKNLFHFFLQGLPAVKDLDRQNGLSLALEHQHQPVIDTILEHQKCGPVPEKMEGLS